MYFYDFYSLDCLTRDEIIDGGGLVLENEDGTVSVYVQTTTGLIYQPLTKSCCEGLASVTTEDGVTPLYSFDIDKQQCRWSAGCNGDTKPFKVVLNPIGNDGAIFNTTEGKDELCTLKISFDYLFQIDCQDIWIRLREVNNTSGLDPETYALLQQLQLEQENCQQEIETLITQLSVLQNELESTPFVIQCSNNVITEGGSSPNPKTPVKFTPVNKEVGGNLDIGFGTMVRKMPINVSTVETYCLTDAGLNAWSTIIGINNYTTWFNSNGTNTTTYSCEHVNALLVQDNGTGNLLGTCHVSLTAREEIWKEIVIIQNDIIQLEQRCEGITTQIEALLPDVPCSTVSEILESLNVSMTLDTVNSTTGVLETVYEQTLINIGEGNLAEYLNVNTPQTGFYSSGSTGKDCDGVWINLAQELLPFFPNSATTEVEALVQNSINSQWLHFETEITDQTLLDLIYDEKIKLSFLVKDCCVDFGIMVDRIKLTKNCSLIDNVVFNITKNPSFDMIRVIDNKKSWLANEEYERREFDLKFRDTQYDINNYKLAINSKELDLDINPANAIEQDLYCYIKDNECLLDCYSGATGTTCTGNTCGDNCCVNLSELITTPLSAITSVDEFRFVISSELIDAKHWKTTQAYPTLRLLYERYLNSVGICDTVSSQFNYLSMMQFSELVGTYWVDLIEQVVPSTAIWGSTYVYGNTIFDQQKFKYRKYSFFGCELPNIGGDVVSPATGWTSDVEVIYEVIENHNYDNISGSTTGITESELTKYSECIGAGVIQTNCGSEFIGTLNVMRTIVDPDDPTDPKHKIFNAN